MRERFAECGLFFREYVRSFRTTGAILPSGRWLAAALARYVAAGEPGQEILEVGPGTGAVTRRIAAKMRPEDRLDLVEVNETFVARLRAALAQEPALRHIADRTRLLHCLIEDVPAEARYDVIVSGLPLNNFTPEEVERILAHFAALLRPEGTLSFFEYIGIRVVRGTLGGRAERARLRGIGRALRKVLDGHEIRRDCVLPNVPPAWVHHVRFARTPSQG